MLLTDNSFYPLINTFDCFGWVPTIRGSLSLKLFDSSDSILGDVDKYSAVVKTYNNLHSSRYLVASSLFTFDDIKKGDYARTFRFIFRGTIKDEDRQKIFINNFDNSGSLENFFQKKELLIGKLSIVTVLSSELTKQEQELLLSLKVLSSLKEDYKIKRNKESALLEDLESARNEMKGKWDEIESEIISIENTVEENPIYKFDVVLSRDGILFLKDDTTDVFRKTYFKEGTANDYTQNVPIHRLFKTAMIFMKCLFHKNYHHAEEHDSFLPASNLHPIRNDMSFSRVIKHQTEAFLAPIIQAKRSSNMYILCNPKGILLYTEAFLHVFENNKFVDEEESKLLHKFIDTQAKDFDVLTSDNNAVRNFFLSQRNIFARITVGLTFLITIIRTSVFLFKEIDDYKIRLFIVVSSFGLGILIHAYAVRRAITKGKYNKKKKPRSFLNRNSNIAKGKLSYRYRIKRQWIDSKARITLIGLEFLKLIIYASIVSCVSFLCYFLFNSLNVA